MLYCYDVLTPGIAPGVPSSEPALKCPYCGCNARKATGKEVYPLRKKLWKKRFFMCTPCDARVGCHDTGGHKWKPLGVMANRKLRKLRQDAHGAFDPIWKSKNPIMTRWQAYGWMSEAMNLTREEAHIGMFNEEQCKKLIEIVRKEFGNPNLLTNKI